MDSSADARALRARVDMTLGREECDLALVHADVVDVFGRGVVPDCTVLVGGGRVLAVVPFDACPAPRAREVVDCGRRPLVPGLMDAHVHIESTLLTPENFARAVLACGTTCVVADPHEIANVAGVRGIEYMLAAGADLPVRILFALPSCVPCTPFEDAGAALGAGDLAPLYAREGVCALGELMNYPGVLGGDGALLAEAAGAHAAGSLVNGHCPGLAGLELAAYAACGVGDDHEEEDPERLREHVRNGLYVFIRGGSQARSVERMLPAVTPANAHRFCFCTDDLHAGDILASGHMNAILAQAVACGLDAPTAVAMATLHPAQRFRLNDAGAVAPGFRADLVLMEDLVRFRPVRVWSAGRSVMAGGEVAPFRPSVPVPQDMLRSMHLADFDESSLRLRVPSGRARVIRLLPKQLLTREEIMDVAVDGEGCVDLAASPGLCKIAVVERHRATGLCGVGLLAGYAQPGRALGGAIATSVSHDSHNIVVAGSSDADMARAVRAVAGMEGGVAVVRDGKVTASLALPVAGLMSMEDVAGAAAGQAEVNRQARSLGVSGEVDPLILIFMSLCVIPDIKMNTRGLFDVRRFAFVPVDAGEDRPA